MDEKTREFYKNLKSSLEITSVWPAVYLFKFIVPTEKEKIEAVENAFNFAGAVIKTTQSGGGKFTSISVNVLMETAQNVIDKYLEVSNIEGIVSL